MFVGRETELEALNACLEQVSSGRPATALVEGEAGVGKSALVRQWLARSATDMTVLRAHCDASEQDLPFGVIGQLTARVPGDMRKSYPEVIAPEAEVPPFHVGAQLLGLVDDLQASGPVVLLLDDVQWVDEASLKALGFALRRWEADAVLTVLIMRGTEPVEAASRVEKVRLLAGDQPNSCRLLLHGLEGAEVSMFAEQARGLSVGRDVAERLQSHTGGNPLYLQTLLTELSPAALSDPQHDWPVPSSLAQAVHRQLANLSEDARCLVEAAAIVDTRVPLALLASVAQLDDATECLESTLAAGLLRWWPNEPSTPVSIAHTLQRDAIVAAMVPSRRRRLHAAAAPLVDHAASWRHRVAAADGADASLARELEVEARGQVTDGKVERAASLLLWAAELSPDRSEYERLLLTAASYLMTVDSLNRVKDLIAVAQDCASSPLRSLVLGTWAASHGRLEEGRTMLTQAREATEESSTQQWIAAIAGLWLGNLYILNAQGTQATIAYQRVLSLEKLEHDLARRTMAHLGIGHCMVAGPRAGMRILSELAPLPPAAQIGPSDAYLLTHQGLIRSYAGDLTEGVGDLNTALRLTKQSGRPIMADFAHIVLAVNYYFLGDWDKAAIHADQALTIATTDQMPWSISTYAFSSWVPSGRGDWKRSANLLNRAEQAAQELPDGFSVPWLKVAQAVHAQAQADHPAMLSALEAMFKLQEQGEVVLQQLYWQPLYVEALIGTHHHDEAELALAELKNLAEEVPYLKVASAWLSGWLAQQRSDISTAFVEYEQGITLPAARDECVIHRAFLQQALGKLHIINKDRRQAARYLRAAHSTYTSLGARPFLERCAPDLADLGLQAPSASSAQLLELTEREADITHLIARGMTNREAARELFVSTKTIEYHLSHIYAKLGITSRRELRAVAA
ncbi:helix-turn-helix transcriptional regulator [Streptomyces virginiae]|uniref:helix-turn-helix transcriptional regulator n=1 Tax=Streptomyces virginiae TaxID=1961 RepID=UPI000A74753B|nr:BREX system ATP-binding domain-containing protein [Streptomyces virginiae]